MKASAASARDRKRAAIGTAVFTVAPATVAGVFPWLLTRWEVAAPVPGGVPAQVAGALLIGAGAAVIANSFVHFAVEGLGTPAPFAPPKHLVVGGLYRYVRNPMYVAIAAAVAGQGLLLGQPLAPFRLWRSSGCTRSPPWPGNSVPNTRSTAETFRAGCPGSRRGGRRVRSRPGAEARR